MMDMDRPGPEVAKSVVSGVIARVRRLHAEPTLRRSEAGVTVSFPFSCLCCARTY